MNSRFFAFTLLFAIIWPGHDARRVPRVLQGTNASPGEFPFTVSLQRWNIHVCGGAIIGPRHVLTAAHCFVDRVDPPYTDGPLMVITGATANRSIGEAHRAKAVTIHSGYQSGSKGRWRNDIAVITLKYAIVSSTLQRPIALPKADTPSNIQAVLSGWGMTSKGGEESDSLKKTTVTVLNMTECNKKDANNLETQLCGFDGRGTGFCNGDSGSPLTYNDEVIGIVSFSILCGIGYPDTYTKVHKYLGFINDVMRTSN